MLMFYFAVNVYTCAL